MERFTRAVIFAAQSHDGACRKGGPLPYILHPMEAAAIAATMTDDCDVLAAAVLHDTVEDTSATIEDIAREFGPGVAKLEEAESENKREEQSASASWLIRKQETIDGLRAETDLRVMILALADKLSNIRAINRDFSAQGDRLWERFNQQDPTMQAWYYASIADALRPLSGTAAWKEYASLVDSVFHGMCDSSLTAV